MTIKEIIDKNLISEKFIINNNFNLDESFDIGTILKINHYYDDDECYEISVSILPEDFVYNFALAKRNWYDMHGDPTMNIYEALFHRNFQGDLLIKPIEKLIFVMEYDDCFDLELVSYRNKKLIQLGI